MCPASGRALGEKEATITAIETAGYKQRKREQGSAVQEYHPGYLPRLAYTGGRSTTGHTVARSRGDDGRASSCYVAGARPTAIAP